MAIPVNDNQCVVCGQLNPIGLHVSWEVEGTDSVRGVVTVPESFMGFQGVVHGGMVTALMDDAMWHAVHQATGWSSYTVDIATRFRSPVPTGSPVLVRARFLEAAHRLARAEASVLHAQGGAVLASASARFMPPRDSSVR